MKKEKQVKKIAVLQAKALGDFIVTLPALDALKKTYPLAELIFLGKPWHKDFLEKRQSIVDRVIVIPSSEGVRNEPEKKALSAAKIKEDGHELVRFFAAMQQEKFSIAIHLQGDGKKTNPFLKKLGAKLTIGMQNEGAEKIDRSIPYIHYQSEIQRNLEIVSLVGATTNNIVPSLVVTDKDKEEASLVYEVDSPFVVMHPGADDMRRRWPAEKFAAVGSFLHKKGLKVVLTGTEREKELTNSLQERIQGNAIDLSGKLSLGGLAALLAQAKLVMSNDTGPLHLARAVGAATVGIYWFPNLLNWGPVTAKHHRTAISFELSCPHCGIKPIDPWPFEPMSKNCRHEVSFVANIPVAVVLKKAEELLCL